MTSPNADYGIELVRLVTEAYYELEDIRSQWGDDYLWQKHHAASVDRWLADYQVWFDSLPRRDTDEVSPNDGKMTLGDKWRIDAEQYREAPPTDGSRA